MARNSKRFIFASLFLFAVFQTACSPQNVSAKFTAEGIRGVADFSGTLRPGAAFVIQFPEPRQPKTARGVTTDITDVEVWFRKTDKTAGYSSTGELRNTSLRGTVPLDVTTGRYVVVFRAKAGGPFFVIKTLNGNLETDVEGAGGGSTSGSSSTSSSSGGGTASLPTVTSVSPTSVVAGGSFTMTGTNFDYSLTYKLGTNVISCTTDSATSAACTAGTSSLAAASYKAIACNTAGCATIQATLTVTSGSPPVSPPTVTSVSPTSVDVGATFTMTGTNFNNGPTYRLDANSISNSITCTTNSATSAACTATNTLAAGVYQAVACNSAGCSGNPPVNLTLTVPTPVIVTVNGSIAPGPIVLNWGDALTISFDGGMSSPATKVFMRVNGAGDTEITGCSIQAPGGMASPDHWTASANMGTGCKAPSNPAGTNYTLVLKNGLNVSAAFQVTYAAPPAPVLNTAAQHTNTGQPVDKTFVFTGTNLIAGGTIMYCSSDSVMTGAVNMGTLQEASGGAPGSAPLIGSCTCEMGGTKYFQASNGGQLSAIQSATCYNTVAGGGNPPVLNSITPINSGSATAVGSNFSTTPGSATTFYCRSVMAMGASYIQCGTADSATGGPISFSCSYQANVFAVTSDGGTSATQTWNCP